MLERPTTAATRRCAQALIAATLAAAACAALAQDSWRDRFVDERDGAFDVSRHLLEHRGFLPVPMIISEPAVGYGAGAALLFFRESIAESQAQNRARGERMGVPNIGGIAAFKTENGSWGAGAGYFGTLSGDRFRYMGAIAKADLNLDFYGLLGKPRRFEIDAPVAVAQGLARVGESDWLVGARYLYLGATARFIHGLPIDIPFPELDAHVGRASVIVDYDSRDNVLTPSRGLYSELDVGASRPGLGGTTSFESALARGHAYVGLGRDVVLGLRADGKFTRGDVPFYALPYVSLRGVPAMRYQGRNALVAEAELRVNLDERWALVGFAGAGKAYGTNTTFADAMTVSAGGAGFRYLIARKLGLYAGLDVARGPEDTVVYLQVGSAWR